MSCILIDVDASRQCVALINYKANQLRAVLGYGQAVFPHDGYGERGAGIGESRNAVADIMQGSGVPALFCFKGRKSLTLPIASSLFIAYNPNMCLTRKYL
jgi:hypothetical protein